MTDAELHHAVTIRPKNLSKLKMHVMILFVRLMIEQQALYYLIITWPNFKKFNCFPKVHWDWDASNTKHNCAYLEK